MKKLLTALLLLSFMVTNSQSTEDSWETIYRPSATKINDLIHTKVDVSFDYNKSWMYGKAWITLHPHFYPTDSVSLDAKGMTIEKVSLVFAGKNISLHYTYDSMNIHITLNKTYKTMKAILSM